MSAYQVILHGNKAILVGSPDSDDESHDCDRMGCSTVVHVLARLPFVDVRGNPNVKNLHDALYFAEEQHERS